MESEAGESQTGKSPETKIEPVQERDVIIVFTSMISKQTIDYPSVTTNLCVHSANWSEEPYRFYRSEAAGVLQASLSPWNNK